MLVGRAADALLAAVDAFLAASPSNRRSDLLRNESCLTVRSAHVRMFARSVCSLFASSSSDSSDVMHSAFRLLFDVRYFDSHLLGAVRCIVDKLFLPRARFDKHTPIISLDCFHWTLQCWFFLRDALHAFLDTYHAGSVEIYQLIDNCLVQSKPFALLLIDVRFMHTSLCNTLRLYPHVMSNSYARSSSLPYAIQSYYYFLQHFMLPTPANDRALVHYRQQVRNFYVDHAWRHIVHNFEHGCANPSDPRRVSRLEQFCSRVQTCREAELLISLHAFRNRHHDGVITLESQLRSNPLHSLISEQLSSPSTRLISSDTSMVSAFSLARTFADFGYMQTFMRHFHSFVIKPPEPSSSPLSITTKETKNCLFYLTKYHSLQRCVNQSLACMKHLKRQLDRAIWHVLQKQVTGTDRAHVLLQLFDRLLHIPREPMQSELSEYRVDLAFKALASLSVSPLLNESESTRFICEARKVLAERFANGRSCRSDEEAERSLRRAHHLSRILVSSEGVRGTDFRNRFFADLQHFHRSQQGCVKLVGATFIDSQKCGIETSNQFLKVPQELKRVQSEISLFYQTRYPSRALFHVNYLSIVELSTSYFAEGDSPISFTANVYQACVLKLFEENLKLRYRQIVHLLLERDLSAEQYNEQKVRIRQALLSLSTERAPLLKCQEGSNSNQNLCYELNTEWKTASLHSLPSLYADAYLSSLDRTEERKLRSVVEPAIYKSLADVTIDNEMNVVRKTLAQRVHPYMSSDFVRVCIQRLVSRGRLGRHVVTNELYIPHNRSALDDEPELINNVPFLES